MQNQWRRSADGLFPDFPPVLLRWWLGRVEAELGEIEGGLGGDPRRAKTTNGGAP